jgi:transcriptional regulator with XRE-family HTH domain
MTQFVGRFNDEQIAEILLSREPDSKVAERMGVSRATIGQIKTGKSYKNVHPEIQRRLGRSCFKCKNWKNNACLFEFPDPIEDGTQAANYCSLYQL